MSNLIKSYAPILLASAGMVFFSSPAMGATTGESIINCDSASYSDDYKVNVCKPLQDRADELLTGRAKAADPILMTEKLNIEDYRAKGIQAVVAASKGSSSVNPAGGSTSQKDEIPWSLSQ